MTFVANSSVASKQFLSGQGVADSSGNCEIDLASPPVNQFYTGTVTVYDSPLGITWSVKLNDITIDILESAGSVGQIQIGQSDKLVITAGGLSPGVTYHATWSVITSPENNTDLIIPGHDSYIPSPAQSVPAATVPVQLVGGVGVNVAVPVFAASLSLFFADGFIPLAGKITVFGVTTNVVYYDNTNIADAQQMVSPITFDVNPSADAFVTIFFQNPSTSPMYVRANSFSSNVNSPSSPKVVALTDPTPRLPFTGTTGSITSPNVTAVLAAPPAGYYNEIKSISLMAPTAALSVAARVVAEGTTSAAQILASFNQAAGIQLSESFEEFYLNEGITVTNSTGQTVTWSIYSRQVPTTAVFLAD